eukprot:s3526_g10.t1
MVVGFPLLGSCFGAYVPEMREEVLPEPETLVAWSCLPGCLELAVLAAQGHFMRVVCSRQWRIAECRFPLPLPCDLRWHPARRSPRGVDARPQHLRHGPMAVLAELFRQLAPRGARSFFLVLGFRGL